MEPVDQVGKAKIYYDSNKRTYFTPSLDLDFETLDQAKDFIGAPLYMGESLNESSYGDDNIYKITYYLQGYSEIHSEEITASSEHDAILKFKDLMLKDQDLVYKINSIEKLNHYSASMFSTESEEEEGTEKHFKCFESELNDYIDSFKEDVKKGKYDEVDVYLISDESKSWDSKLIWTSDINESLNESSDYYSTKKPLNHRITSKNWNEFISLIENETGLYVEAPNKYSQWIELIDFDDRVTYDVEITKYMDGTYELVPDNISSPLKSKE